MVSVHPVPVEREAEDCAEAEADNIGDIVRCQVDKAQEMVRKPEAPQRNDHAPEGDNDVLDQLTEIVFASVSAEGPVAVADPVEDDRHARRDDLRAQCGLCPVVPSEGPGSKQVENSEIDAQTQQANNSKLDRVGYQALPQGGEEREKG